VLEKPTAVPDAPGSYQFKDADGRVIYVGKARSLRSRLSNYFADRRTLHPRTAQMMERAASLEWIVVQNDVEAIMLEFSLIKAHRPRFNVRLVDDKSYPYLAVTVGEEWPRATVMRGAKRTGVKYFGPYAHAYAIRETLDLLLRSFPIRTCSDAKLRRHQLLGRPCLMYHIERCAAPCVGNIDRDRYGELVTELIAFLSGETKPIVQRLEEEMREASAELEFERAARLRDRLQSVKLAIERQQMVTDKPEDLDVLGVAEDDLVAAVQVLHIRRGRVVGRHGFVMEKVEPLSPSQLLSRVLEQHYGETPLDIPRTVLVPEMPEDAVTYEKWLSKTRSGLVEIRIPKRGRKRELLDTARQNAAEQLNRHRLRRSSDLTSRALALEQLQKALELSEAPLRIECYDMSHLQGSDYVGSMVVLEDGLPKRSDYRRFKVSAVQGNDDYGAMHEVLTRRLRYLVDKDSEGSGKADDVLSIEEIGRRRRRPSRFSYPPQLLLVDGGKGQLNVAVQVLDELGLGEEIGVAALAKRLEEVFVPGRPEPVVVPRDSEAIYLLQQARDEAHRFAITYHRQLRGKRMTRSALDGIPGLGPSRRKRLISEMGGVRAVQAASLEDLRRLSFLPQAVAESVYRHLHPAAGRRAEPA
jgi:excinuclease ABC subunit C